MFFQGFALLFEKCAMCRHTHNTAGPNVTNIHGFDYIYRTWPTQEAYGTRETRPVCQLTPQISKAARLLS